jgi:uncharacterized damage-inducible protein DinB
MSFDEPADLIGSCEATLDTLGLLLGDLSEEIAETPGNWSIAEVLNHMLDTEKALCRPGSGACRGRTSRR